MPDDRSVLVDSGGGKPYTTKPRQAGLFSGGPSANDRFLDFLAQLFESLMPKPQQRQQPEIPRALTEVLEQEAPPLEVQNIPRALPNYLTERKPSGYQLPGFK